MSLEANPTGSGAHESAANVMSLMSCMDNMHVESALTIKEGESELEFDFEMSYDPISEADTSSISSGCEQISLQWRLHVGNEPRNDGSY